MDRDFDETPMARDDIAFANGIGLSKIWSLLKYHQLRINDIMNNEHRETKNLLMQETYHYFRGSCYSSVNICSSLSSHASAGKQVSC